MADLIARVDSVGQSATEVGKETHRYLSDTPMAAVAFAPPLPLVPPALQVVRKVATLPFAPIDYVLGKALPILGKAMAMPFTPASQLPDLPRTVLNQLKG